MPGEAGLVRGRRDVARASRAGPRPTGTATRGARRRARSDAVPARPRAAARRGRCGGSLGGRHAHHVVPALVGAAGRPPAANVFSCSASTRAGTGRSRAALRRRHRAGGSVEGDRDGAEPVPPGEGEQRPAPLLVEPEGVDDGGEAAAQPAGHDQVEQCERLGRGVEVVASAADQAAQVVRGDDLGRPVPLLRPRGLAGGRRPDQHDESRVGQRPPRRLRHTGECVRACASRARQSTPRRRAHRADRRRSPAASGAAPRAGRGCAPGRSP